MPEEHMHSPTQITAAPGYRTIGECEVEIPKPCGLVIFGASGDLAKKKLIPSLYHLHTDGLLPSDIFIMGAARTHMDDNQFRELMRGAVQDAFPREFNRRAWGEFAQKLYYSSLDYTEPGSYVAALKNRLPALERGHRTEGNRIFYLAVPPSTFEPIVKSLDTIELNRESEGYTHIVVEKPFGYDLASAGRLNAVLGRCFDEKQIFRIDHYLAKETVQSILMFRFANSIFEPLWNRRYVDHVQITVAETVGIEQRAGYYEQAGVIRDMFQNHMFQLLALTAMEPPVAFEADRVRDEKVKVFRSIRPFPADRLHACIAAGQYGSGTLDGRMAVGYREEPGVPGNSITPTYAAMKVLIDSWRWDGVPFYLRSGKRLSARTSEISVHFKQVPHLMFAKSIAEPIDPNVLILRIQPDEGIRLVFRTKRPGSKICLDPAAMNFRYQMDIRLDAYEWVLLDCMLGDHMLFLREDGVEQTWSLLTPVIRKLGSSIKESDFPNYAAGSSGPPEAAALIERDGRRWMPL